MREFNVNEYVWVKLTPSGRIRHKQWYEKRYESVLGLVPYRAPEEDDEGWSRWQLWDLMSNFGELITLGMHPPFHTSIRLDINDGNHS